MKNKSMRLVALIVATICGAWVALLLVIIGAHVVEEILDGDHDPIFEFIGNYTLIFMPLCLIAVAVAWFKNQLGGLLLVVSGLGLLHSGLASTHFGEIPYYLLSICGVALFILSFTSKKENRMEINN